MLKKNHPWSPGATSISSKPGIAPRRMRVFSGEVLALASEWAQTLAEIGIRPGVWQLFARGTKVSTSAAGHVYRVALEGRDAIYIKLEIIPPKRKVKWWLRPGKSAIEAFSYQHLKKIGIPTLTVLGFAEHRTFGFLDYSMIITKELPTSIDLENYASKKFPAQSANEQRATYKMISTELVDQLQRAHASGFVHHDLKWRNILLEKQASDITPVWIDAPRGNVWRIRKARMQVVDLCDLAIPSLSITGPYDRMRFVCRYLGRTRKPGEATELYRRVMARVDRRLAKTKLS